VRSIDALVDGRSQFPVPPLDGKDQSDKLYEALTRLEEDRAPFALPFQGKLAMCDANSTAAEIFDFNYCPGRPQQQTHRPGHPFIHRKHSSTPPRATAWMLLLLLLLLLLLH
jgi:hypothetical protein